MKCYLLPEGQKDPGWSYVTSCLKEHLDVLVVIFQSHVQKNDISELVNMSGPAFSSAMRKAYEEGLGVDFALVCQGVTKRVHSQVIPGWNMI